jgi:hypothetical protein
MSHEFLLICLFSGPPIEVTRRSRSIERISQSTPPILSGQGADHAFAGPKYE